MTIEELIKTRLSASESLAKLCKYPEKVIVPRCYLLFAEQTEDINRTVKRVQERFGMALRTYSPTQIPSHVEVPDERIIYVQEAHQTQEKYTNHLDAFVRRMSATNGDSILIIGAHVGYQSSLIQHIPPSHRLNLEKSI